MMEVEAIEETAAHLLAGYDLWIWLPVPDGGEDIQ